MSIEAIGVPGQPLGTPGMELTEWQAAVRDAINSQGEWTTYMPAVAGATYSSLTAQYTKTGQTVVVAIRAIVSAVTGDITFSPPVAAHADVVGAGIGTARMVAGAGMYLAHVYLAGGNTMAVRCPGTNGAAVAIAPTMPATWVPGNQIVFVATYKAAS